MIIIGFAVLTVLLLLATFFCLRLIVFNNQPIYLLYFLLLSLPLFLTYQILAHSVTDHLFISNLFRFSKDAFVFIAILMWLLYQKRLFEHPIQIQRIDSLLLIFLLLVLGFFALQIGPASLVNQLIYLKGIIIGMVLYFFGRNFSLNEGQTKRLLHLILIISFLAFPIVLLEKIFDTHLQAIMGYSDFQLASGGELTGNYGLTWTFEAESGAKRFASFFASPLELASFSILSFISSFALWRLKDRYAMLYVFSMVLSFLSLLFSYSRAPLLGFFLMLIFVALLYGYWRYLFASAFLMIFFFAVMFLLADTDLRYFILDTITLSDSSSTGHVLEWLLGIESMISNPFGLGLATSGNAGGVEEAVKVGGENQFIVYGVQLGWLGMFIYLLITIYAIKIPAKVFLANKSSFKGLIPFIASSFKVAFIVSLLTANAETYGLVVYLSWWMVGYSVKMFENSSYPYKHYVKAD